MSSTDTPERTRCKKSGGKKTNYIPCHTHTHTKANTFLCVFTFTVFLRLYVLLLLLLEIPILSLLRLCSSSSVVVIFSLSLSLSLFDTTIQQKEIRVACVSRSSVAQGLSHSTYTAVHTHTAQLLYIFPRTVESRERANADQALYIHP